MKMRMRWQGDPRTFLKDNWPEIFLWDKLEEILNEFVKSQRLIIPAGHGVGKTFIAARLVLAFLYSYFPAKVITTAPTWNQVESVLWSEIKVAYATAKYPLGGRLLNTELKIKPEWFAMGFSTKGAASEREYGAASFQGFHSPNLLLLFDEAPGIEHAIWVSGASLLTGANNKWVAIGNPTSPSGDFYEACKSPLWKKIVISCFDHPNVKTGTIIVPGAVTREWVEERKVEWGVDSPLWQAKVLGQFPTEGENTLVALAWAEACVGLDLGQDGLKRLGEDIARYGNDMTVLTRVFGPTVMPQEVYGKKDTSHTIGRTKQLHAVDEYDAIGIDDTGVGGGITDALMEEDMPIEAFNFGASAIEDAKFENLKAEIYWNLREDIKTTATTDRKLISLPNDPELINQICSIKFKITRKGKIAIESKDDMKKRGLKSPDKADSLAIAWSAGRSSLNPTVTVIGLED